MKSVLKRFSLIPLILILLCLHFFSQAEEKILNNSEIIKSWKNLDEKLRFNIDVLTSGFSSRFEELSSESSISSSCLESFRNLFSNASNKEAWATEILESWGRFPPEGIFSGKFTSFGSFEQCLNAKKMETNYCSTTLSFYLPKRPRFHSILSQIKILTKQFNDSKIISRLAASAQHFYYVKLRTGVCLPQQCSEEDVRSLMKTVGNKLYLKGDVINCVSKKTFENKWSGYQTFALLLFSSTLLLAIFGTVFDHFYSTGKNSELSRIMLAFSAKRNLKILLRTENLNTDLSCLNGIRFLSLVWIIVGHAFIWIDPSLMSYPFDLVVLTKSFISNGMTNATLPVETFYFISGLLTSYVTWKTIKDNRKLFSSFGFVISRYMRIVPGLIFAMASVFFLPLYGDGPIYDEVFDQLVDACKENWWINLFFVQNFFRTEKACMRSTWWLANDFQFHVLSVIVVLLFMRKIIYAVLSTLFIVSVFVVIGAAMHIKGGFPPTVLIVQPQVEENFREYIKGFYIGPYVHAIPFYSGLLLGFLIAKGHQFKLSKTSVRIGWFVVLNLFFINFNSTYFWNNGASYGNLESLIYTFMARLLWSLCLVWLVYMAYAGDAGFVGKFLSWKLFVPLARISYMTYLTHELVITPYIANTKSVFHLNVHNGLYMFLSHLVLSLIVGFVFTLLFESPFLILQKNLLQKLTQPNLKKNNDENINENVFFNKEDKLLNNNLLSELNCTEKSSNNERRPKATERHCTDSTL